MNCKRDDRGRKPISCSPIHNSDKNQRTIRTCSMCLQFVQMNSRMYQSLIILWCVQKLNGFHLSLCLTFNTPSNFIRELLFINHVAQPIHFIRSKIRRYMKIEHVYHIYIQMCASNTLCFVLVRNSNTSMCIMH